MRMGSEAKAQEERRPRGWVPRGRRRRQSPLPPVLAYLEQEFPHTLGDLICPRDLELDLVDSLVALTARLLRARDPRALALTELLLEAYPYRPVAHLLWSQALAQAGFWSRASAVLRNLLVLWPDFPGRAQL